MRYLLTFALGITTGVVAVLSLLWKPVQRPDAYVESDDGVQPMDPYLLSHVR